MTMTTNPATRRYLEQMMVRFVALGVPVDEAAPELVEIEAHIAQSEFDPFDELGDPQELATSLIPEKRRRDLYREGLRNDLLLGTIWGMATALFVQGLLSMFGSEVTSVPRLALGAVFFGLWGAGQFAFARILTGIADDDSSLRLRGAAQACAWGIVGGALLTSLLAISGADFSGQEPFERSSLWWFAWFAVVAIVGSALAIRSWKIRGEQDALIEGGITGQIIYEMNHNGFSKGWVRYGLDGTDLRDPDYSILGEFKKLKNEVLSATHEEPRT